MKTSRRITYSAAAGALASLAIIIARLSPVRFVPLMVASVCFFIALCCGLHFGLISMVVSVLLASFWGSIDLTLLLIALLFAPYSIAAFFMRKLRYALPVQYANTGENWQSKKCFERGCAADESVSGQCAKARLWQILVRAGVSIAIFNAALALIVFVLVRFVGEVLIGFNPLVVLDKFGLGIGYSVLAVLGSVLAVGFDIMFVRATDILLFRLKINPT